MSSYTHHMVASIQGILNHYSDRQLKQIVTPTSEKEKDLDTGAKIRSYLKDLIAQGHVYMPCGPCPSFDSVLGCRCKYLSRDGYNLEHQSRSYMKSLTGRIK